MLGDIFLDNVASESYDEGVNTTNHPIEGGKEITDHIEQRPVTLKITGVVTGEDAASRLSKLRDYMNKGKLLKYTYRSIIDNVIIESFPHDHVVNVKGGFEFDITLKQIRIASVGIVKSTAQPKKTAPVANKGRQQPTGNSTTKTYTVNPGDTLSQIAQKHNVTTQKLHEKNRGVIGPDANRIYPGQKLIIPA